MGQQITVDPAERDFLSGYANTLPKDKDGNAPTIIPVAPPKGIVTDRLATMLAKAFGRQVGWFEGPENHSGTLDPNTGKIWLNAKSPESFATGIVADEGMHWMKQAHADVYNEVLNHFQGLIAGNQVDPAFSKWLEERGYDFTAKGPDGKALVGSDGKPVMDASRMNEEMLGHLGKDMMKDPEFWTATFQHNPGLGRRFIAKLREFVLSAMDKLKGVSSSGRDATSFLQSKEALESMRDNLATAYATMMHRERATEVAKRFPDDLDWPQGPERKPIKTAPDIPVVRTVADGRKRPGGRDNPVANQGLGLRAYSDRTESEQAKLDADLKAYERFHQVTDLWSVTSGDARKAIVDAAKNYKGGDVSFRTYVANLFNDPKFVDKPDFGAYLYYHFGAPDANMVDAHGHHITYKKWIEDEAPLVKEIHDTLNSVGINPIVGLENLIHAPNIEGQHSTEKLQEMADRLNTLKKAGGKYADFVKMLSTFGRESREVGQQQPPNGKRTQ